MTDGANLTPDQLDRVASGGKPTADELRDAGIDHPAITDDEELVDIVWLYSTGVST